MNKVFHVLAQKLKNPKTFGFITLTMLKDLFYLNTNKDNFQNRIDS